MEYETIYLKKEYLEGSSIKVILIRQKIHSIENKFSNLLRVNSAVSKYRNDNTKQKFMSSVRYQINKKRNTMPKMPIN